MHETPGKMYIEEVDTAERSFEEFHVGQLNFDLLYLESPDLLVSLVNSLLADIQYDVQMPEYLPCLTYSECHPEPKIDAELLWYDDYSRIQSLIESLSYRSIPRSVAAECLFPKVIFASRNKSLMIGAPQLFFEDVASDSYTTFVSPKESEDSWINVAPTISSAADVSGWQLIA